MTEQDQRQLRRLSKEKPTEKPADEGWEAADQVEGEREGVPAKKVGATPGQAEGDRETVEEELKRQEEKYRK